MAVQKFTVTPTGATSTGISLHFADGHTAHYKQGDILTITFDGTFPATGDPTVANPDPMFTQGVKTGNEA